MTDQNGREYIAPSSDSVSNSVAFDFTGNDKTIFVYSSADADPKIEAPIARNHSPVVIFVLMLLVLVLKAGMR